MNGTMDDTSIDSLPLDRYRSDTASTYDTIRYDTIEEFNVDSKAEYTT